MNKFCEREVYGSKSPFNLARSVPDNSFKTVYDAWNGYHSVPIFKEDCHLTTFITPWDLFRYKRAPQGFLCVDGYNRRFSDLTWHIYLEFSDVRTIHLCIMIIWNNTGGEQLSCVGKWALF